MCVHNICTYVYSFSTLIIKESGITYTKELVSGSSGVGTTSLHKEKLQAYVPVVNTNQ